MKLPPAGAKTLTLDKDDDLTGLICGGSCGPSVVYARARLYGALLLCGEVEGVLRCIAWGWARFLVRLCWQYAPHPRMVGFGYLDGTKRCVGGEASFCARGCAPWCCCAFAVAGS